MASKDPAHWEKMKRTIKTTPLWDLPIAQRWRHILEEDWTTIPDTPSPLTLDRATRQHSIKSAISIPPRDTTETNAVQTTKLILHFPSPRRRRSDKRKADLKRKALTTREPLRGSDANGENAGISLILERCTPRRITHNKNSTYVEEFLVQWDPEYCTLHEAQIQQAQGFVITSITSLEEGVPTPLIEAATA